MTKFAQWCGGFSVAVGAAVLAGWVFDVAALKTVFPGYVTMKANTAFGLLISGAALMLLAPRGTAGGRALLGRVLGAAAALLGILTLGQEMFGWDLGIDEALIRDADARRVFTSAPGRMAVATTLAFALLGFSLVLLDWNPRPWLAPAEWLAFAVIAVSSVAVIAYLYGRAVVAYEATRMAVHTSITFYVLAIGVIAARPARGLFGAVRAHVTGRIEALVYGALGLGILTLFSVGASSIFAVADTVERSMRVERSHEVRAVLARLLSVHQDLETGMRGYVIAGRTEFLVPYHAARASAESLFDTLGRLVRDDPLQAGRLPELDRQRRAQLAWTGRVVETRDGAGAEVAQGQVATGEGKRMMDALRAVIAAMDAEEQRRLEERAAEEHAALARLRLMLVASTLFALAVAVFSAFVIHRAFAQRQHADAALEGARRELQDLYDHAPCGYHSVDENGLIVRMNDTWLNWLGYTRDEVVGRMRHPDFMTPQSAATFRDRWFPQFKREGVLTDVEFEYRRRNGSTFVGSLNASTIRDAAGRYVASRSTVIDVTERRRAIEASQRMSAELAERARQLEIANRELESFSYSVSHDLRAPLRHIHGYAEMLSEDADSRLSEEGRRCLGVIQEASTGMAQLIDDLLAFSRMGRAQLSEGEVDLAGLVAEVRRGLETEARGRRIRWTVGELPWVTGDRALLRQLFANLLGNAVKYTRPRDPAQIEVGCSGERDGRMELYVKDNGVGFDMKYAGKLFGVFQRLHRAEEFEGTGVGLATARRIVERHGGEIWAEAALHMGAAFYFTLKARASVARAQEAAA